MTRASAKPPAIRRSKGDAFWQLQTAKAQFCKLFRLARTEGPQWVTRQANESVVILRAEDFERLEASARQTESLVEFFAQSPLAKFRISFGRHPARNTWD
jgi:prevent-host-death family protein